MSDDLDDGEISVDRPALKSSHIDSYRSATTSSRERSVELNNDRKRNDQEDRTKEERSRAVSPKRHDRLPVEAPYRSRPIEIKKAPSIHDAHTRADIGRLAREAEAAAYKARNAALTKGPSSSEVGVSRRSPSHSRAPLRPASPRRSYSRTRSRSPGYRHGWSDRREPPRTRHRSRSPRQRSPPPFRSRDARDSPRRDSSLSREHVKQKAMTAADIGRMEREKEAAAYKAKVLGDAARSRQADGASVGSKTPVSSVTHTSLASNRAQPPKSAPSASGNSKVVSEPVKDIVQRIQSRTPRLDQQLAVLKDQYDLLTKAAMTRELALAQALQGWVNAERELKREEYKSELAQQSLEATTIL